MIAQLWQDLQKQAPSAQAERSPNKVAPTGGSASEASVYTAAPTSLSASAEAERFGSESVDTQDMLENMTTEEAIEMAMLLVWPQLQLATPPTAPRARVETEGPCGADLKVVQIWNEGREQELGRIPTAEAPAASQLQFTSAPPAPTGAFVGRDRVLPSVSTPLLDLPPLQRLSGSAALPPATAPSRASELLTAAAAHRTFVEHYFISGGRMPARLSPCRCIVSTV